MVTKRSVGKSTRPAGKAHASSSADRSPAPPAKPSADAPPPAELLDMDQAIALLKTTRPTFYRWLRGGRLTGMKVGRQWRFDRAEIERFLRGEQPRIELRADIDPLIDALRSRLEGLGVKDPLPPGMAPLDRAMMLMVLLAARSQATDFHIEPQETARHETAAVLRYRIDGVLHPVAEFDMRLLPPLIEKWKSHGTLDVREKQKPQFARAIDKLPSLDEPVPVSMTFLPGVLGESLTVRLFGRAAYALSNLDVDKLGLAPADRDRLVKAVRAPYGLTLVAAPAGAGKTTTLYSCLLRLAKPQTKVITIEDPVEHVLPGVTHVAVRQDAGATYAVLMRAAMLSAPNIVMLSEIGDRETLQLVLQAALTGHLVLGAVRQSDAALAVARLIEMGAEPQVLIDGLRLVVAQRLVRTLCPECSQSDPSPRFQERAADLANSGGLDWGVLPRRFRRPVGCARCNSTGYAGRTIVAETLQLDEPVAEVLRRGGSAQDLRSAAIRTGMTTFAADAVRKASEGLTSLDEVMGVVGPGLLEDRSVAGHGQVGNTDLNDSR